MIRPTRAPGAARGNKSGRASFMEALNKSILDFPACNRQVRARKAKMRFSPSCLLQAGLQNQ